jgi:hypothetical protein
MKIYVVTDPHDNEALVAFRTLEKARIEAKQSNCIIAEIELYE